MVQCKECGYLARWDERKAESAEAVEIMRSRGRGNSGRTLEIFCFVGSSVFLPKVEHVESPARLVERISCEIDCPRFLRWISGRSPREHEQMSNEEKSAIVAEFRHQQQMSLTRHVLVWSIIASVAAVGSAIVATLALTR